MKTFPLLFGVALLVQGCTYAISPAVSRKADTTVTFEKLQADPGPFAGKLLILGGTIADIAAMKQGTLIEVIHRELDYWGKPERTERTAGRFYVVHPKQLDPMVYAPGRDITIAGEVQKPGSQALDNRGDDYPVLLSKELRLWERERPSSWDKPRWIDPLYEQDSPARHD
jgi:outer membrane lipoprotein